ncbi:hypothetical protein MMC21_000377 [Puttea exsequens]|nr:hypothetical protein [Puttea exsequens]
MVMEPMAKGSAGVREGLEKSKFRSGIRRRDAGLLGKRKREDDGENVVQGTEDHKVKRITESDVGAVRTTKSRGPKGPNPLSVKKAKKDPKPKSSNGRDSYEATSLRSGADSSQVAGDSAANRGQKELDETLDRPVQRKRKRKPKLLGPEGGVVALEET